MVACAVGYPARQRDDDGTAGYLGGAKSPPAGERLPAQGAGSQRRRRRGHERLGVLHFKR
ncbi:hypothetical protein DPMN_167056 [Dreissena polymorpha]|uniref:Uncharacterized protein n=1 Tax=Dreissena polymorpha TaxID=45954 RepID=A0A9D4EZ45_DREPO|nr:hypothetical protein DPMN_167056 [Dreissena polymorpha]